MLVASLDILSTIGADTVLKKVSSTNGGEYAGACPWCGGEDRFRVWPEEGRFWCRSCEKRGDAIPHYLRDKRGLTFPEACNALGIEPRAQRPRPAQEPHGRPGRRHCGFAVGR